MKIVSADGLYGYGDIEFDIATGVLAITEFDGITKLSCVEAAHLIELLALFIRERAATASDLLTALQQVKQAILRECLELRFTADEINAIDAAIARATKQEK